MGAELAEFAPRVWLNEDEAWGGGPFQNGTSDLPDLWRRGLNDRLFLWFHAQMLNPTNRKIYGAPPRQYYVHAAKRLAKLVAEIRARDPKCPVTIVCHSQGCMVTLASAFFGTSEFGGRGVADTYVVCNAPYSLEMLFLYDTSRMDPWRSDASNSVHNQNGKEREATFAAFLQRVAQRKGQGEDIDSINRAMAIQQPGKPQFALAEEDHFQAGKSRDNRGKAFLYCNPHDAVISASPVQGIGWRGVTQAEMRRVDPSGKVFTQRVWAQGFPVGDAQRTSYHYWYDHYLSKPNQCTKQFWHPESPRVCYQLTFAPEPGQSILGKIVSFLAAPFCIVGIKVAGLRINADPPENHSVPVNAPPLPKPFLPTSTRAGQDDHRDFDEGSDDVQAAARGQAGEEAQKDAALEARSEARRQASAKEMDRFGLNDQKKLDKHAKIKAGEEAAKRRQQGETLNQDEARQADQWQKHHDHAKGELLITPPQQATDHSTILKNVENCRRALAYDVAVGRCRLTKDDWRDLRELADWRYVPDGFKDPYYRYGQDYAQNFLYQVYPPSTIPPGILDEPRPKTVYTREELDL